MRRSHSLRAKSFICSHEASAGMSVAEICRTAAVTPRTFYRWRRRFGGLSLPAVMQMKDLAAENHRLRGLVSSLIERLRAERNARTTGTSPAESRDKTCEQQRAIGIAAEKCGGALTGRFASVRVNPKATKNSS